MQHRVPIRSLQQRTARLRKLAHRVAVAALGLLPWLACQPANPTGPEATHWEIVPVAAFNNLAEGDVRIEGLATRRWQRWGDRQVPVVVAQNGTAIHIRLDDLRGARIRGGYALGTNGQPEAEALFRVRATTAGGDPRILFEERLAAADTPRTFEASVPAGLSGPGEIVFEATVSDGIGRMLWFEPEIALPLHLTAVPAKGAPNVLIVTSDTTRQDTLGLYGGAAATPALEALAADGVRLDQMYSLGYGTLPSHASLFSGSHPREHGVYDNATVLSEEVTTLAEVLLDAGYETAAFVSAKPVGRGLGLTQGFLFYDDVFAPDAQSDLGSYSHYERRAERTTDRFLQWLDSTPESPFAAWIHFFDPHQPYVPPTGAPEGEPAAVGRLFVKENGNPAYLSFYSPEGGILTSLDGMPLELVGPAAERRYQAEIEAMDHQLGRLIEELKRRGVYDETLIVFVSDHGENFLDRGARMAYRHAGLHGEVTRLASVIKLPGRRHAGRTTELLTANADLACLSVEVAGLVAPADWPCRSFLAHLGEDAKDRPFRPYLVIEGASRQEVSIRTPQWSYREALPGVARKALNGLGYEAGSRAQLFDLRQDPDERHDLVGDPEHRADVGRLHEMVRQFLMRATASGRTMESDEHLESLKALGYLD